MVDGATDSVVATVKTPYWSSWALCYNPANNKVYCADYGGPVTVIALKTSFTSTVPGLMP